MGQEGIIEDNDLLFHFGDHNIDLLVLKRWNGALTQLMPSLLGHLKNND